MTIKLYTVATDPSRATDLFDSAIRFGWDITNLGAGVEWEGGDMSVTVGGMQKFKLMREYLRDLEPEVVEYYRETKELFLFLDGYDTIINDDPGTVEERARDMLGDKDGVIFAAEKNCWPDGTLAPMLEYRFNPHTEYKYPNSGAYIGTYDALLNLFSHGVAASAAGNDDQLYVHRMVIRNQENYVLDQENYIFQCTAMASDDIRVNPNGQLINNVTHCCPCIIHFNGGGLITEWGQKIRAKIADPRVENTKEQPVLLTETNNSFDFIENNPPEIDLQYIGQEIFETPFMNEEECEGLIQWAEQNSDHFKTMPGDKFPGQELRIHEVSPELFKVLGDRFMSVCKVAEREWWPLLVYGIRDMFIIKYEMGKQTTLPCHHDASLITGSVKLNDNYTGGELYFHRQSFSNINTEVGTALVWPSQVTHGHECKALESGTKYSLTIWTSRYEGDINF